MNCDGPVTVFLTRTIRAGKEAEYEQVLAPHLEEVQRARGHLGMNVFRPGPGSRVWSFIFKFDHEAHLRAWQSSSEMAAWNRLVAPFTEEAHEKTLCGLETWFSLPGLGVVSPPPKWKMAVATWLAIYPTITLLLLAFGPQLSQIPLPARTLIITGALVPLMTFVIMPKVSELLRFWLYSGLNKTSPIHEVPTGPVVQGRRFTTSDALRPPGPGAR
ncbi:MAG: antibiotic biosynthesis monooxygenase [Myxococcota bacterium]